MSSKFRIALLVIVLSFVSVVAYMFLKQPGLTVMKSYKTGDIIDSLNGVYVYYDADGGNTLRVDMSDIGYVSVLKYPSEEFVMRYYEKTFQHRMPDTSGHPRDFFDKGLPDGTLNRDRGLIQFSNSSSYSPQENDILVYTGNVHNRFGHVAIISAVKDNKVEVVQQNTGKRSRAIYVLTHQDGKYEIRNNRVLGWLRIRGEAQ